MRDHTDLLSCTHADGDDQPRAGQSPKVSWRAIGFMFGLALAMLLVVSQAGCAARVGKKNVLTPQKSEISNGSPNALALADKDGTYSTEGVGPQSYSELTPDSITTLQQGSTPRRIIYQTPDGTRIVVDSGSDVSAQSIEYGDFKAKGVSLSASAPIAALGEAQAKLVAYWTARDQASAEVLKREMETIENVSPAVAGIIKDILRASGVPIP